MVKLCATPLAGLTDAPAETVIVGTRAVTAVPAGTATLIAVPLMVPTTSADSDAFEAAVNTKELISFALERGGVGFEGNSQHASTINKSIRKTQKMLRHLL